MGAVHIPIIDEDKLDDIITALQALSAPSGTDVAISPTGMHIVTEDDVQGAISELDAGLYATNSSLTKYVETTTTLNNISANTGGNVVVYFDLPTGYKAIGVMLSTNGNNLFSAWVGDRSGDHFRLMYYNQRTSATNETVKGTVVCVKDNG